MKKLHSDYIKGALRPLDYYRHELPTAVFKKLGWNDAGLCPFHNDNSAGSFKVNLITGAYKCFACGESGGDVIAFTMSVYGLQFIDALAKLANDWGIM
jgi:DNA primase